MKKRDCYFYSEYADMGAHIPCCDNHKGLGNCPCEECTDFLSKNDADKAVREYVKIRKQIEDAIAEIKSKITIGQFMYYADDSSAAYGDAVEILQRHTGVKE